MAFFDELGSTAQNAFDLGADMLDQGMTKARGVINACMVEQQPFVKQFAKACAAVSQMGWHEANGGNLSYVLDGEEVRRCLTTFQSASSEWIALDRAVPQLASSYILTTATGAYLSNVPGGIRANAGIVQVDADGAAIRIVWGFSDEARPTSELAAHMGTLAARIVAGQPARVMYHAHPESLIALTAVMPLNSREMTRALWQQMAECIIVAPRGLAVLGWIAPGTTGLAQACSTALCHADAVLAQNHGVFVAAGSFDEVIGRVQTLEKAASIRLKALAATGGQAPLNVIPDEGLREIAKRYKLDVDEAYL